MQSLISTLAASLLLFNAVTPAVSATGTLTVDTLSLGATGSVPRGAQRVPMLRLRLTASCEHDVTLGSLTIQHRGLGRATDIERVYAVSEGVRITRSASVTDDGLAIIRFRARQLPKCTSLTFDVLADIAADAASGGEHRFALERAADLEVSGATVRLGTVRTTGTTSTAPTSDTALSVEFLSLPRTLSYGDGRIVAVLRLTGDDRRDQLIHAIMLTNDGSARGTDLQNLSFVSLSNQELTPVAPAMDDDAIRLTFDPPLRLLRRQKRVIQLQADVRASRKRTVRFTVEEPSDIEAERAR